MPTGRAVLLFRRLSTGDNRFKSFNLHQTSAKETLSNPVCNHRDLGLPKRYFQYNIAIISQSPFKTKSGSNSLNYISYVIEKLALLHDLVFVY